MDVRQETHAYRRQGGTIIQSTRLQQTSGGPPLLPLPKQHRMERKAENSAHSLSYAEALAKAKLNDIIDATVRNRRVFAVRREHGEQQASGQCPAGGKGVTYFTTVFDKSVTV